MIKRAALIVTGTLGGLSAVLAITPPQFGNTTSLAKGSGSTGNSSANSNSTTSSNQSGQSSTQSNDQAANQSSSKGSVAGSGSSNKSKSSNSTGNEAGNETSDQTQSQSQPQAQAQPQQQSQGNQSASAVSGTFTGNAFEASERGRSWGSVVVKVTFKDGVISSVSGNQSPASRGPFAINQLDPYVAAQKISIETIKAKSAEALPYVSGVSYTCVAYWNSLKSAINKAGL